MQKTKLNKIIGIKDEWLMQHAKALIAYAKTDKIFAESLAQNIKARDWKVNTVNPKNNSSVYLVPETQTEAVHTALWLIKSLDDSQITKSTRGLLTTWAQNFESPKDLIFGIIGMAIIGPTLGIISSKKKRKSKLRVIIDKSWFKKQSIEVAMEHVQNASMKLISQELQIANGNAYSLHPDSAAWLLEEPDTKIYLADKTELSIIKAACDSDKLSHQVYSQADKSIMITISPTVNDSFEKSFEITKPE